MTQLIYVRNIQATVQLRHKATTKKKVCWKKVSILQFRRYTALSHVVENWRKITSGTCIQTNTHVLPLRIISVQNTDAEDSRVDKQAETDTL